MMSECESTDIIMTARDLTLRRDRMTLLDSVSVQIRRGSITLLLGHNGAGKTPVSYTHLTLPTNREV